MLNRKLRSYHNEVFFIIIPILFGLIISCSSKEQIRDPLDGREDMFPTEDLSHSLDAGYNFLDSEDNHFQDESDIGVENSEYIVNTNTLNVRSGPGLNYPVVKKLKKNHSFFAVKLIGDWIKISQKEYVFADFVIKKWRDH